jgi:hypothetical protein
MGHFVDIYQEVAIQEVAIQRAQFRSAAVLRTSTKKPHSQRFFLSRRGGCPVNY